MEDKVREQCRYSGNRSNDFWKRINSLPKGYSEGAYLLGCALQDLEYRMLVFLQNLEANAKKKKTKKRKATP